LPVALAANELIFLVTGLGLLDQGESQVSGINELLQLLPRETIYGSEERAWRLRPMQRR